MKFGIKTPRRISNICIKQLLFSNPFPYYIILWDKVYQPGLFTDWSVLWGWEVMSCEKGNQEKEGTEYILDTCFFKMKKKMFSGTHAKKNTNTNVLRKHTSPTQLNNICILISCSWSAFFNWKICVKVYENRIKGLSISKHIHNTFSQT